MLIIRKDANKTLAFNTVSGRQLALDTEGGEVFIDFLRHGKTQEQADFLTEVCTELDIKDNINFRVINNRTLTQNYDFEVLDFPTLVDLQITTKCNLSLSLIHI